MGRGGVEPPTSRFSGERSYRLSYLPRPVDHRRATLTGLEPATSAVTGRRANQLRYRALLVYCLFLLSAISLPQIFKAFSLPDFFTRFDQFLAYPQRDSNPCRRRERAVS